MAALCIGPTGRLSIIPTQWKESCCCKRETTPTRCCRGFTKRCKKLNNGILPKGVKIVPFLDRSDLVKFTVETVEHNLTAGVILVSIILFLFLGNVRGAIIVALTIPFALLFAAICLDLIHIPANLLSLGALDFGMVVDGSVVMIENMVRHLSLKDDMRTPTQKIRDAAHEVQRPVFFARGIIIASYLPIFTLQAVEGRLFKPMAWTVTFALVGALVFAILVAPVMGGIAFRKGAKEWENPIMKWLTTRYRTSVRTAILHRKSRSVFRWRSFAIAIYFRLAARSARNSCRIWMKDRSGCVGHCRRAKDPRQASTSRTRRAW